MKKRLLSFLLSAALILSVLPLGTVSVSAAEHNPDYTHKYDRGVGVKDKNTTVYLSKCPSLQAFINKLGSITLKCSSSSVLAPVTMVETDAADASSYLVLSVQ